jgi:hypothetical protein
MVVEVSNSKIRLYLQLKVLVTRTPQNAAKYIQDQDLILADMPISFHISQKEHKILKKT